MPSLNFFTVIFFGFLPLCAGYALAWAIRNSLLRLRKRAVAAALFGSFLMLAMVGYAPDDPRYTGILSIALITTVVLSIVVWLLYPRWLSRLSGTAIAAIGGLAALCAVPAFLGSFMKMHPMDYGTVRSPDGRYEARLIYYDGLTYGYYYVSIEPVSPIMRLLSVHEVAEAKEEGFDDIRWKNSRTLVIDYDSAAGFAQKDRQWRDVAIEYDTTPTNRN